MCSFFGTAKNRGRSRNWQNRFLEERPLRWTGLGNYAEPFLLQIRTPLQMHELMLAQYPCPYYFAATCSAVGSQSHTALPTECRQPTSASSVLRKSRFSSEFARDSLLQYWHRLTLQPLSSLLVFFVTLEVDSRLPSFLRLLALSLLLLFTAFAVLSRVLFGFRFSWCASKPLRTEKGRGGRRTRKRHILRYRVQHFCVLNRITKLAKSHAASHR